MYVCGSTPEVVDAWDRIRAWMVRLINSGHVMDQGSRMTGLLKCDGTEKTLSSISEIRDSEL